jgi:hypothetical protein
MKYDEYDEDDFKVMFNDLADYFRNATPEERKEIAEYMINLWKEWAK